jgi:hypothetical protein
LLIAPLLIGLLASLPRGAGADAGALAVVDSRWGSGIHGGLVVAAVFEAATLLVTWCSWSTLTRAVVVGEGWLAWRPRSARRWRTLALFEVVSMTDQRWQSRHSGVRLSRANGGGVFLRQGELDQGIGWALGAQLAEHPAATPAALEALRRSPSLPHTPPSLGTTSPEAPPPTSGEPAKYLRASSSRLLRCILVTAAEQCFTPRTTKAARHSAREASSSFPPSRSGRLSSRNGPNVAPAV